jgi:hypothetical protein
MKRPQFSLRAKYRSTDFRFVPSGQIYYRSPVAHYLAGLSILMIGDSELGWRGASLTAYCLLLLLPALIVMRRGPTILGPAWGSFCRAIASDFALCILGENVHGVHAVLYLGDRAECILEADEMGSKGFLYLLTSLAASFSNEHFIVFAPSLEFTDGSVVVAGTRAAARFAHFPAIRYPGFSDRLRSSHTLRGPIFAALVSQRDFNACIPRCFVPGFDGAFLSHDSKDALRDKFYTAAPPRRRQSVE